MTITIGGSNLEKNDNRLIAFVLAYFLMQAINLFVKMGPNNLPMWELFSYSVLALYLVRALYSVFLKKKLLKFIIVEFIVALCFGFTWLLNSSLNDGYSSIVFHSLFVYIPLGWCVFCIDNYSILAKKLYHLSWPISIILLYLSNHLSASIYDYYMMLGYTLLLPLLVVLDHFLHDHKWYDLLIIVPTFVTILVVGSRGPLVCFFAYILLKLLFWENITKRRKVLIVIIAITIGVVFSLCYKTFVIAIFNLLLRNGISSRTLIFIINDNYTDSGRFELYRFFINEIKARPFLGWGLSGGWKSSVYPHNIYIELMLAFGVVLGSVVSVVFTVFIWKGITKKNSELRRLTHIFVSICISLLFSNSFIMEQTFFILLALCIKNTSWGDLSER